MKKNRLLLATILLTVPILRSVTSRFETIVDTLVEQVST